MNRSPLTLTHTRRIHDAYTTHTRQRALPGDTCGKASERGVCQEPRGGWDLSAPGRWYAMCFFFLSAPGRWYAMCLFFFLSAPGRWYAVCVCVLSIQFVLYFYRICSLQNVCTLPLSLRNMFSTECTLFSISIEYVLYRMYVPCLYLYRICSLQNVCTRPLSLRNMFSTECMYLASISIEYVLYRMYLAA